MADRPSLGHPYALAGLGVPFLLDVNVSVAGRTVDALPDVLGALLVLAAAWGLRRSSRLAAPLQGMAAALVLLDGLLFAGLVGPPGSIGFVALDLASVLVWIGVVWLLVAILIRHAGDRQLVTWAYLARGLFAAQGAANWLVSLVLLASAGRLGDPTSVTWQILTGAILAFVAGVFVLAAARFDHRHPLDLRDRPRLQRPLG